uniref:Integrase catalytic domain-containing protein n=1 Tax=Tanacetum cinerariifolium TaxID=118510 RepID=A0A6L2JD51_TANCI|nr:hypothetical protein [Tanacetum cinerariifolium]
MKGIKREFSVARTPQQNGVAERKNRTLIEAARIMLVDSKLPTTFWAEAVNTACYVLNRALVIKPHNKTPYKLIHLRPSLIDSMKPFGCHVTILNTRDSLGKFDGNTDEGFFIRYSVEPKITLLQVKLKRRKNLNDYILIPICTTDPLNSQGPKDSALDAAKKATEVDKIRVSNNGGQDDQVTRIYQTDVKSAFLYGKIEEEVYVCQPPGFEDPDFPDKVYKKSDGIFISQEKYVADILKKFYFTTVKTTRTLMEPYKASVKDAEAKDVDVHLYRSLIYLTTSRPDITFVVCAYARFQVTPKTLHLHVVKRIFRYLKGQPKLGLWYPKDSPFDLEAYFKSDYAGAILDNKFTTGEYVAAASCCRQVLWIQNQMLDYGFNLMNTKIYTNNKSTVCIVKNPVFHSKTRHIEIRHHFIIDSYEKKLIQVIKIHTDHNVADLLTKAFDAYIYCCQMKVNAVKHKLTTAGDGFCCWGTACLPNDAIFKGMVRIGAKTTAWNELSSTMASPLPLSLTKKVFANIKWVGTGFTRVTTPLFETMMVQPPKKVGDIPTDTQDIPILTQPSSSQPQRKHKLRRKLKEATEVPHTEPQAEKRVPTPSYDPLPIAKMKKLKKRIKKLKGKKKKKRTRGLNRLYKGRIKDQDLFGVHDLDGDEVFMDVTTCKNVKQDATVLESVEVSDKVKTGLGYKAASPAVESFVNSSEMLENQENVKSILDKGYHVVPLSYTGNYIPPKPDLMFIDEQVESESVDVVSNVTSSNVKTIESKHKSVDVKNKGVYSTVETKSVWKNSFSPPIIED